MLRAACLAEMSTEIPVQDKNRPSLSIVDLEDSESICALRSKPLCMKYLLELKMQLQDTLNRRLLACEFRILPVFAPVMRSKAKNNIDSSIMD